MHRFRCCCKAGCKCVYWVGKYVDSDVVVTLGAYMFAW